MHENLRRFAAEWIGIVATISTYAAVGLSTGGLAAFAAHFLQADAWTWFFFGFCLPIGPLYVYFSSERSMRKLLIMLRQWHQDGLITDVQYEELCESATRWFAGRRFGTAPQVYEKRAGKRKQLQPRSSNEKGGEQSKHPAEE